MCVSDVPFVRRSQAYISAGVEKLTSFFAYLMTMAGYVLYCMALARRAFSREPEIYRIALLWFPIYVVYTRCIPTVYPPTLDSDKHLQERTHMAHYGNEAGGTLR